MNENSPFEKWRLANLSQVVMNSEILELLAMAFEGGRQSRQEQIEYLHNVYERACEQRDILMDQQRAMVEALRGKLQ